MSKDNPTQRLLNFISDQDVRETYVQQNHRTMIFDVEDDQPEPNVIFSDALVMVYAIIPEDLSSDFGYISQHPVYESIRSIKGEHSSKSLAVVGLVDLGNGRTVLVDLQHDRDREISMGPYFGNVSATMREVLQGFLEYSLGHYAGPNTKTLFWWIGHGNGYHPRLDLGNDWDDIKPGGFARPLILKRKPKSSPQRDS